MSSECEHKELTGSKMVGLSGSPRVTFENQCLLVWVPLTRGTGFAIKV